ncbi:MAG: glycosyltransferase family 9 protein [Deltaproteobacteria bacterium]|nr:glycosyltransferase family 9 protein [Deltaproteobacteria bacterium]
MNLNASNILIVKYSSLGDVVNAIPAVGFLRKSCPKARIHWLVKKEYEGLLSGSPLVDEVVLYGDFFGTVRKIRSLNIDCVVDLQGLFKSALIGYLSGAKVRVCFPHTREGSALFYTRRVGLPRRGVHAIVENLSVVEGLLGKKSAGGRYPAISLNGDTRARVREILGGRFKGFIAVSPTSRWRTKMWGAGNFALFSDMLIERMGVDVVFTGVGGDSGYIEGIRAKMKNPSLNLAGKTDIKTLAGVFSEAGVVVSCDSGAMHLASATGTPVVAIFGPTDPSYTGPFNKNSLVITSGADCAPCRRRSCGGLKCMEGITPRMVSEGVERVLSRKV